MDEIESRLQHAVSIALEAGGETLKYFRKKDLEVIRKSDGSPVTLADRGAEQLLRERIRERFPDDGILGEEFGDQPGTTGFRWVLDPIDGTKSFIHGVPLYTTLVAVMQDAGGGDYQSQAGVVHAPATGETVYARRGGGCWMIEQDSPARRVSVSSVESLAEGLLVTSEVASFEKHRDPVAMDVFLDLQREARLARTWGDAYGYLMVACGRADAAIDPIVNLWDIAALPPIIEEAGGRFTDWQGEPTVHRPDCFATNGRLHEAVLRFTRGR